jgi:hypothetical protein
MSTQSDKFKYTYREKGIYRLKIDLGKAKYMTATPYG